MGSRKLKTNFKTWNPSLKKEKKAHDVNIQNDQVMTLKRNYKSKIQKSLLGLQVPLKKKSIKQKPTQQMQKVMKKTA